MDGSNGASLQKAYDIDDQNDSYNEEGNNDAPYLLSNMEVLEILQPRVHHRRRTTTNVTSSTNTTNDISTTVDTTKSSALAIPMTSKNGVKHTTTNAIEDDRTMKKRQKLLRHRNWIEDEVVQYIQQTAAMEFHSTQNSLPLKSILRRRKRRSRPEDQSLSSLPDHQSPTTTTTTKSENEKPAATLSSTSDEFKKIMTMGFHLTEAEVIQILNHSPKEMVDLHLYVDQIHERFTMSEQEDLLRAVDHYRTLQPLPTPNNRSDTSTRQSNESNHRTNTNNCMTCNGVDTSRLRYSESSNVNGLNDFKQGINKYEYEGQLAHIGTTTAASSVTVAPSVHAGTNPVKLEMSESDDRKPASI
jgi:RNA polymerase Rpb4